MTTTPTREPFIMIGHSVQDYGLTPQAFTIYAAMVRRADWSTRETYVSRGTLAEVIGTKQPRSADKYVRELIEAGLVTSVRHRWTTQARDMDDIVFVKDDEHPVQTSSLYALAEAPAVSPQVGPQCATAHGGGALQRTGVVRQNAHNQEPLIKNPFTEEMKSARTAEPTRGVMSADGGMSTAQARAWLDGEPTKDPHPLHPEWAPNSRHRDEAAELGLDVVAEAEVFRQGMTEAGERRRRWGAAFTEYLREQAAGVAGATFDVVDQDAMAAHAAEAGVEALRAKLSAEAQAKGEWFDQLDALMRALPGPVQRVNQLSGRHIAALDKHRLDGFTPEGILDALRAKQAAAAETPEVVEDQADDVEAPSQPSAPVAEVVVDDAEWHAAVENRRVVAALRAIDRRLLTRKLRGTELAEAEAMLRNGMHQDRVYEAIVAAYRARRAEFAMNRPA